MSGNFGLGWLFSGKSKAPRTKARRRDSRPLRVEMLESKLPLAGNITAVLFGTQLTLTGDAASNGMQISGANGLVRVIGLGSTINGQVLAQFNGVADILIFDTGGNDVVTVSNLTLAANVFARLDNDTVGNDVFTAFNFNLGGSLDLGTDPIEPLAGLVNSSAGIDVVSLTNVTVGNDIVVVTGGVGAAQPGAARDSIVATRVTANDNDALNFSSISTGNGPDSVVLSGLNINSQLVVSLSPPGGNSSAADVVSVTSSTINGDLSIITDDILNNTSRGNDAATVSGVTAQSLTLLTQGGNDVVSVLNSTFGAPPFGVGQFVSAIITGGVGGADRDTVTITGTRFFGGLALTTGDDADYVVITLSTFFGPGVVLPHTSIDLGNGNDILVFNSNQIDDVALMQLLGGAGFDIGYAFFNTNLLGNRAIFPQGGGFELLVSI